MNNACVSSPVCRERERERGDGGLRPSIFDCTPLVISTMLCTSLSMPEKGNIFISKQKHSFSQGAFVCKHEDLSEYFGVVCNQKDGLRWVIFSPENVGQLISYYHISAKLEHIYPEKQQSKSKKESGSKQMEEDGASRRNAGKKNCTLNEFVKHSHPLNNFTLLDKLYNIATGNLLQRKSMLQMQFIGERMKAQYISNFTDGFQVRKKLKFCEFLRCNADCWISVTNGTGPHISV